MSWDGSVPTGKVLGTRVPTVSDELGCGKVLGPMSWDGSIPTGKVLGTRVPTVTDWDVAKYLKRASQLPLMSWDGSVPTVKMLGTRVPTVTNELGCGNVLGTRVPTAPMSWDGPSQLAKYLGRVSQVSWDLGTRIPSELGRVRPNWQSTWDARPNCQQ